MLSRLCISVGLAAIAVLGCAGGASAFHATMSPAGSFEAIAREVLWWSGSTTITCDVTLLGTLASYIPEVEWQEGIWVPRHVGSITRASIGGCDNGATVTASELPWEFGLLWMEGGLPNEATAFDLEIAWTHIRFNLFGGSVNCEYYDGVPAIMPLEGGGEGSYSADSLITDESVFIQGGVGFGCPSGVYMAGTFRFSETEWITVS